MLKYSISILFFVISFSLFSQKKEIDTVKQKDRYGLRVGIDLLNPILSFFDDEKTGLEFVGDYRITKRFYIAGEFGYNKSTNQEDYLNFTTNGGYLKLGADYNAYKNLIGMENMLYVGVRYAFGTFEQTLNQYSVNADPFIPTLIISDSQSFDNLSAQWLEFVVGLKVEVLHNVYLGFSIRTNKLISSKEPENFKNLYIPGFTKVFLNNNGFSFNYTISYLIPLYKKPY
ncbi:MAG: DUF6048 family protein [Flavobacteriaceae bacterium]|nr:DUF6048 family protein [Flavobacteriaceae bacterium]